MGTLIHSESRRLYSWWWDSHISPKNSKWLQENLTDMDAKVKSMIKLIEEDADSFAKRAEMYYKKRPELIKLVEEFYRAYRALAERYDHATGALHQAHRTMSEAFPSQVPFDLLEDLPSGSSAGDTGPRTPDMPHPTRALFDPDDLHKDALGPSSSQFHAAISKLAFADETKFLSSKKGLKQLNEMFVSEEGSSHHAKFAPGRVKRGINFRTDDVKSSSDYTAESKTQSLTEALAKIEAETEERLRQYQQSLQRLGDLETEVSRAQEDSKELNERASKAESEVQTLKQSLSILEDEKEAGLLQIKQCLERISNLENKISLVEEDSERYQERAGKTETEVQFLKQSLAKQEAEKESILFQYRQSLERIANMEMEISRAKENAEGLSRRATKAETEAQTLREILARLESEKEAGLVQYKMSLETITDFETRVSQAEKDAQGLHERASKAETEAQILQEALVELQSENEAGLLQYKQCLDKISDLDSKVSLAEEEAEELHVRASDAETEAQNLKEFLARLESEKEAGLVQYKQCLETISNLEREVSRAEEDAREFHDRACKAETEAQTLQETLSILESEKETGLLQNKLCQETICNLETKISHAEEVAERLHERAEKAESNVKSLEQLIATLHEEKANAALEYQNCLKTVANLETELSVAQEEVKNLNSEIEKGVAKLKNSEEHNFLLERDNQSLQADIASLVQKTENQRHKLLEKHEELEKLWCSLQEESFRSMQVEASFHTLKDSHFHSLEERKSLAMELQKGVLMLKGMELSNQNLERELHQVKEENDELNEQNSSYAMSMKSMKAEIFNMRGTIGKHEEEGRLLVDQKHALQQELYCLKEDIENLDRRYQGVIEQVNSVGLNPDCLWSTVKGLQVENSNLKDTIKKDNDEKIALLGKLKNMEKLMQKNTLLENSLSEINAEIERLRMKVEALESSHSSLDEEKRFILGQKSTLVSQLEIVTVKMEKLSKENDLLENSISDKNDEVEALRRKLNFFEESYWSLENEKSCISTERDILLSNLEGIEERLEVLQTKYAELEEKYSNLEKEKAFTSRQVKELKYSLDSEKQEHANFIRSSEIKLAHFEDQIYYLQEESRRMQKEFEEEEDKAIKSQVEIFIMHRSIKDMAEKNLSLMIKCHKYFEASKKSETSISELELKLFEQQVESNTSLNKLEGLRMALHEILKSLEIEPDYEIKDDKMLMQHILHTIEDIRSSLLTSQDENQKLLFEKLILVTFLERLRVEASEIECAKNNLDQKFKIRSEELMLLQREKQELLDTNEQLRLDVKSGEQREGVLKAEVENLYGTLSDLKESNCVLEYENYKVKEEKKSLTKECSVLKEENFVLQEENGIILGEVVTLGNISLILKSYCTEKSWEIEVLGKNIDGLHGVKGDLEKEVTTSGKKLEIVEMENIHLKSSVVKLEDEFNTAREMNDQVFRLLEKEKDMLSRKELELSEAEHKLKAMQSETEELRGDMIRLKMDNDEARVIREELEKQNLKELEDNTRLTKEIRFRKEAHEESESELLKLQEEIKDCKLREKKLSFELEKEVQLQEVDAATLYTDLQMSTICSHLFESKVLEVVVSCKNLEDENTSKETEIRQLRERLSGLEGESEVLKLKLAAYLPVMDSLKDNIISFEGHLLPETATQEGVNQDGELSIRMHEKSCQEPKQEQSKSVTDGVSYLQELQSRVKSVEKELMEMGKLRDKERLDNSIRLDVAMKENEDLKSKTSNVQEEEVQMIRNTSSMEKEELGTDNLQVRKTDSEISEKGDEIPVKDIPLDQISECSSCDRGFGSRGISRRVNSEIDDQMLELWGTSGSIEPMINMPDRSENPESELEAEKELRKDKLEISKRRTEPNQEANKRKFLERLASDGQKLSELQITIQNLRKDVEKSKKNKKTKSIEYNNIKQQIKDFEETLVQLVDGTGNLIKKAEEGCLPSRRSDQDEFEASAKRWRRIIEQAKEGSEKIGRLELELKEIQSVLLKLGTQNGNKGINGANKNAGILLRDYIYGGVRGSSNQSKKKLSFFACIRRPSTKEE